MLREIKLSKMLMGRLPHGVDLYESIQNDCLHHSIRHAWVNALGAVSHLAYFYYDQDTKKYIQAQVDEKLEILSATGNVSLKDGKPFLHMHLVCADRNGHTVGGHLSPGTKVFACEVILFILEADPEFSRTFDQTTGLHLWNCDLK